MEQTSLIPGEEELRKLTRERDELREATIKLAECLVRYQEVEKGIEFLKKQVNEATNGEYRRKNPWLWDESPEQLEEQADAILEANGLDAETAEPTQAEEVDEFGHPIFRGDSNPEVAPTDHGDAVAEDGTVALSEEDQNPATAI